MHIRRCAELQMQGRYYARACPPSACPWALLQAPRQAVSPISSVPTCHPAVLTLQRALEWGELVETQIAGLYFWNFWFKTLGWASEFVFSTSFQLMLMLMLLVPWLYLEDHSSRENRFLFWAAWSVQLFILISTKQIIFVSSLRSLWAPWRKVLIFQAWAKGDNSRELTDSWKTKPAE